MLYKFFYLMFFFISLILALVLLYICYIENSSNGILDKFIFCIYLKKESYVNDDRQTINLRVSLLVDHFLSLLNSCFFFFSLFWMDDQVACVLVHPISFSLSFLLVCYFVTFCCPVYFSYQA